MKISFIYCPVGKYSKLVDDFVFDRIKIIKIYNLTKSGILCLPAHGLSKLLSFGRAAALDRQKEVICVSVLNAKSGADR